MYILQLLKIDLDIGAHQSELENGRSYTHVGLLHSLWSIEPTAYIYTLESMS